MRPPARSTWRASRRSNRRWRPSSATAPSILITHRLAALSLANRIVAMEDGKIIDVGTHAEMLARCGLYRRLHQLQFEDLKRSA